LLNAQPSKPKVSIGICAWRSEYVERAIRSVLTQEVSDVEVVVTDETGETAPIVEAIGDGRVRYHRNERRMGIAGNARAAFDLCRGTYIGLLGDDDRLLPGYLSATCELLDGDPELGVVFTNYYLEEDGVLFNRWTNLRAGRHDDFLRSYLRSQRIGMSATLMRRDVWDDGEREHPMPDGVAPDLFVYTRAAAAGWPFYYLDRPLMAYRLHGGMTSRSEWYRDFQVDVWRQFSFDDPGCEAERARLLAEALVERGAARVRTGDRRRARADFALARGTDPNARRRHRLAYESLARMSVLSRPALAAFRAYRRVRPATEYIAIDRSNPVVLPD
jgi:glycosyltransferase involved in cell wall biosynthesis